MKAVTYESFGGPVAVNQVDRPVAPVDGVVIAVRAAGICRSDWHGWRGHDPDIVSMPHVPGHEFAGEIIEVGCEVRRWQIGDRVTMPFVAGCGVCRECRDDAPQVCDEQFQPGFTAWGALAEQVAIPYADFNLVRLPESLSFVTAAGLGCRVATAYRAVVQQGGLKAGEWVAVHGCGGLGLSVVMIAAALGGRVVAIDVKQSALSIAEQLGAEAAILAGEQSGIDGKVRDLTDGGVQLSLDAYGSAATAAGSIRSLRKRGRHIQVGLLAGADASPPIPLELAVARELRIVGSHGMAASDYPALLELAVTGKIDLSRLITALITLDEAPEALVAMGEFASSGITIVDRF